MSAAKKDEARTVPNASDGGVAANQDPRGGSKGSKDDVGEVKDRTAPVVGGPDDRGPAAPAQVGGPEIPLQTYVVKFDGDVEIEVEASTAHRAEQAARNILAGRAEVETKSVKAKGSK